MVETTRTPVFDRYQVQEKIGSGGMGTVYQARDLHLDRWVALKVLPPGMHEDGESVERFKREARALARLKHEGVAAVYDASVEGGFPYLVMEFVEGKNLERVLEERGTLSVDEVVRLGIDIAEALDHIHRHRIIHRDLKTSNIIIRPEGRAVLADFGIAFVASLPRISLGALGTPEYMSPEQAAGRPLDGRADLYSLGVVLFECLTGTVPFRREGDSLAALTALMKQVQEGPVPPVRTHRPDVPVWLASVVERCLAKTLEERYASGAELAVALKMAAAERHSPPVRRRPAAADAHGDAATAAPEGDLSDPAVDVLEPGKGVVLISHLSPVEVVAFSPDSRRLVTASKDQKIRVWEVATGRLLHTLEGHEGNVLSVSFSPNGLYLASGDVLGSMCIWDAGTGRLLRTLQGHIALVMSVAFSPDGRLASGGADGAVRVWDVKKGHMLRTLGWHTGYVLSLAFSPDGRRLASGSADGSVHVWGVQTGRLLLTLDAHPAWVTAVAFSPDGDALASGGADGAVRLWQARTGQPLRALRGHAEWVLSVALSPNGKQLASAGRDGTVRLWEVEAGRALRRVRAHNGPVTSVAFSPDGRHIASGSSDHTVRLWRLKAGGFRRPAWLRHVGGWILVAALAAASLWGGVEPRPAAAPAPVQAEGSSLFPGSQGLRDRLQPDPMLFGSEGLVPDRGGWTLVVAARTNRAQAEEIAAQYRKLGYRAGVLGRASARASYYSVGVGQFPRQADAAAARTRLAGPVFPHDTWMMRIRRDASP